MMQQADRQRLTHIYEYCVSIEKAIQRFGSDFQSFDCDEDFQHSLSFCLLQIGELGGDCLRSIAVRRPIVCNGGR